jgi:RNA polymerase sigma factor (sigma-70 family)
MPNALSATVARIGRALYPTDLTDGQLVGRFVASRDGDAFAALVRRHGPMVLAVCRRVAGEHHLAEDAFQAAFLVLARRAADVKPREAVRSWLYGVAVRTAREARAMSARRREVPVAAVPDRPAATEPPVDADTLRALDEEMARLPEHLRAAVVLCELDGTSRKDAAARLGIPEGTLSSRLAKARKLLAARLRGRGVALSAGLSALLGRTTDAAVPAALSDAAGWLVASTCVPAAVAELSRGVFRIMLLKKLKILMAGTVMLAVASGLAGLAVRQVTASDSPARPGPQATRPTSANARVPKAANPGKIVVWNQGEPILIDPDGTGETKLPAPPEWKDEKGVGMCRLSPDGSLLLAVPTDTWPRDGSPIKAYVRSLALRGAGDEVLIGGKTHRLFWAPDGAICGEGIDPTQAGKRKATVDEEYSGWRYDPKTKTVARIPKEEDYKGVDRLLDAFPDGKRYLIQRPGMTATAGPGTPDPGSLRILAESGRTRLIATIGLPGMATPRVSPDGKSILYSAVSKDQRLQGPLPYDLFILDVAGGKPRRIELQDKSLDDRTLILSCCWSPDGKRVAFTWVSKRDVKRKSPGGPGPQPGAFPDFSSARTHLTVADADGKNAKTILTLTRRWIGTVDWRAAKADAPRPSEPRNGGKPAAPKAKGLNRLLVANGNKLVLIDPRKQPGEGTEETVGRGWAGRLSPDGRWLALEEQPNEPLPKGEFPLFRPVVRRLDRKGDAIVIPKLGPVAPAPPRVGVWSADSSRLLVEQPLTPARSDGWHEKVSWWLFDPTTGKADRVPVSVPAWHTIEDWSPDGRTFLTMHYVTRQGKPSVIRLALVPRGGGKPELITPDTQSAYAGRFSPDGKRILFVTAEGDEQTGQPFQLFVMDLKDRKPVRVSDPGQGEVALSCSWSPDGKRVAYVRRKLFRSPDPQSGGDPGGNFAVVVADADGKNPKVVMARSVVDKLVTVKGLLVCNWR